MGNHDIFHKLNLQKSGNGYSISLDFDYLDAKLDAAQYAWDVQAAADILNYMPIDTGNLRQQTAALNASTAGTGVIYLYPPASDYGHYQWKGELYVDPITGKGAFYSPFYGFWSRPGVEKVPSGRPLNYSDPMAEKEWEKAAYRDHKDEWVEIVRKALES